MKKYQIEKLLWKDNNNGNIECDLGLYKFEIIKNSQFDLHVYINNEPYSKGSYDTLEDAKNSGQEKWESILERFLKVVK